MLVSENFGDYVMTEEFARYVNAAGFEPVFCMPYDPASKGQSEAVVKYVKNNFLAGRTYVNLIFSFLYTYNSCFSTLALAGRPLFLVIGLAFET